MTSEGRSGVTSSSPDGRSVRRGAVDALIRPIVSAAATAGEGSPPLPWATPPLVILPWVMVTVTFVVFFNLVADVMYAVLDPRIRYGVSWPHVQEHQDPPSPGPAGDGRGDPSRCPPVRSEGQRVPLALEGQHNRIRPGGGAGHGGLSPIAELIAAGGEGWGRPGMRAYPSEDGQAAFVSLA